MSSVSLLSQVSLWPSAKWLTLHFRNVMWSKRSTLTLMISEETKRRLWTHEICADPFSTISICILRNLSITCLRPDCMTWQVPLLHVVIVTKLFLFCVFVHKGHLFLFYWFWLILIKYSPKPALGSLTWMWALVSYEYFLISLWEIQWCFSDTITITMVLVYYRWNTHLLIRAS